MLRLHTNSSLLFAAWAFTAAWGIGVPGGALAAQTIENPAGGTATSLEVAAQASHTSDDSLPLLAYRRSDDSHSGSSGDIGSNPLRSAAAPPSAASAAQLAIEEATPGEPRYATPAAAVEEKPLAGSDPGRATAAAGSNSQPVAALEDYDPAPPADYEASAPPMPLNALDREPVVQADTTPTVGSTTNQMPVTLPAASAIPYAAPLGAVDDNADRRLAPLTFPRTGSTGEPRSSAASFLPSGLGQFKGLASAGAGLAIVIALFLLFAWAARRGAPKASGVLPEAAFAVLGRAPLSAQSFAQLLRVGNKLVLVAMTADGAQPLTEVTDPLEVDRIAGLCMSGRPNGSSAEFQQVLAQLSREPARGFLGREAAPARRRA